MPRPKGGTLSSLVAWLVSRVYGIADIFKRVLQKFPDAKPEHISNQIEKYGKQYGKLMQVYGLAPLTERQLATLAKTGKTRGFTRCTLDVTWRSPNSGEVVDGTWFVDVPNYLTGKQLKDYVTNALYARFNEAYGGSAATLKEAQKFIESIDWRDCQ